MRQKCLYILKQQELDEWIVRLLGRSWKRRKVYDTYLKRNEEELHTNLIIKHLIDDESRFHNFVRLMKNQYYSLFYLDRED